MDSMWAYHTHKGNGWELKILAGVADLSWIIIVSFKFIATIASKLFTFKVEILENA